MEQIIQIWYIKGHQVSKISGLEYLCLLQSFLLKTVKVLTFSNNMTLDTGVSSRPDKEDNSYLAPLKKAGDKPYFADGFPYLLLSKPSVDQLNTNLENSGADLQVGSF